MSPKASACSDGFNDYCERATSFYCWCMTSAGTVREWHHDEGWGIIDSPDTPNGARAEWSVVLVKGVMAADGDITTLGIRPGTNVRFEWARTDPSIEDFDHYVTAVWPADGDAPANLPPRGPYTSWLWVSGPPDPDGLSPSEQVTKLPAPPPRPAMLRLAGTVRDWNREFGWGVIDSPQTPGGAWTHYSEFVRETGFRSLTPGEAVEFDCEDLGQQGPGQDGYHYRAKNVTRSGTALSGHQPA